MVQPFCSIYNKTYRWFGKDEELETAKPCLYFSELKENFRPLEDSKAIYNPERDEAVIKDLHLKRLTTTYYTSYCARVGTKSLVIDPDDLEADEFIVYFNNYYKKKTQAVPTPVFTGRRVFGYCRFDHYYTGKSTYQEDISKEGYEYFKKDYEKGWSRLFKKKQLEKRKLREKENVEIKREKSMEKLPLVPAESVPVTKEKVCALCCEKFGDFSYMPSSEKNDGENGVAGPLENTSN